MHMYYYKTCVFRHVVWLESGSIVSQDVNSTDQWIVSIYSDANIVLALTWLCATYQTEMEAKPKNIWCSIFFGKAFDPGTTRVSS